MLEAGKRIVDQAGDLGVREASRGGVGARSIAPDDRPAGRDARERLSASREPQHPLIGSELMILVRR
jgi:hypothetical protein